tara:strand:+ start:229 stop:381 length:153 start_codon:yes stop_codon:yes gene_type:complete
MLSRSLVARQSWPDCLPSPARKRHVLEQRSPVNAQPTDTGEAREPLLADK